MSPHKTAPIHPINLDDQVDFERINDLLQEAFPDLGDVESLFDIPFDSNEGSSKNLDFETVEKVYNYLFAAVSLLNKDLDWSKQLKEFLRDRKVNSFLKNTATTLKLLQSLLEMITSSNRKPEQVLSLGTFRGLKE